MNNIILSSIQASFRQGYVNIFGATSGRQCSCIGLCAIVFGQVDSPELPETPEITVMTENFTKVTKYLTKLKETSVNYVWEKSHVKKQ